MSDYGVKIGIKADIPYSNLLIPTSKDCYKYSYFPRSITLWNQLPTTFTTADTVDGFKRLKSMIPVSALLLEIFFFFFTFLAVLHY
jgi:hypothetical protein